jgi:hypothetical protein
MTSPGAHNRVLTERLALIQPVSASAQRAEEAAPRRLRETELSAERPHEHRFSVCIAERLGREAPAPSRESAEREVLAAPSRQADTHVDERADRGRGSIAPRRGRGVEGRAVGWLAVGLTRNGCNEVCSCRSRCPAAAIGLRSNVAVSIDASRWPMVQVTCPQQVSIPDVSRFMRQLDELFRARGPMLLMCDLDGMSADAVTPLLRKKLAEEADRLAERGAFVAEAIIIRNPILRTCYAAYTWARRKHDYPSKTFGDIALAKDWLCSHESNGAPEQGLRGSIRPL